MDNDEIKDLIEKEIAKTEAQIIDYKEMTKPLAPDDAIGRVSRMDAINNRSVIESALRKSEEKLSKLNYVLTQMGSPEFGLCRKCHGVIPIGRIMIKPESQFCVRCTV